MSRQGSDGDISYVAMSPPKYYQLLTTHTEKKLTKYYEVASSFFLLKTLKTVKALQTLETVKTVHNLKALQTFKALKTLKTFMLV